MSLNFGSSAQKGPVDSHAKTLGDASADYSTLATAIADEANWLTLAVYPGTYTYDVVTLPTGKTIYGVGSAEECILQSTNTVDEATVVQTGGAGCVLENLTMLTANDANKLSKVVATPNPLTCRNVHWAHDPGGTLDWWFDDCNLDQHGGSILKDGTKSQDMFDSSLVHLENMAITYSTGTARFFFGSEDGSTVKGCTFVVGGTNITLVGDSAGGNAIAFTGCVFRGAGRLFSGWSNGDYSFSGCDIGGWSVWPSTATAGQCTVRLAGNTNYGSTLSSQVDADIVWESDAVFKSETTIAYTIRGHEGHISCDTETTAAFAVTLCPVAQYLGGRRLRIVDEGQNGDGYAATNNLTIIPSGAELINGSNSSRVINTNNGYIDLELNADGDEWLIVGAYGVAGYGFDARLNTDYQLQTPGAGAGVTFDLSTGRFHTIDMQNATGDVAVTLTNPIEGRTYSVRVIQGVGGHDLTWTDVLWPSGTIPVVTGVDNSEDFFQLHCVDAATPYYYGTVLPDYQ